MWCRPASSSVTQRPDDFISVMTLVFKLLSLLPLWLLHSFGWLLGWIAFLSSGVYRRRFMDNVRQAGIDGSGWHAAVGEAGKMAIELPRLWKGRPVDVQWQGMEHVEQAIARGLGIVFLTPHLGCFEVTAQAYAAKFGQSGHPMTVLFRPPRRPGCAVGGRIPRRAGFDDRADDAGRRQTIDQSAQAGPKCGFAARPGSACRARCLAAVFGPRCLHMTLSARLALQTGAEVLVAWGERLSRGVATKCMFRHWDWRCHRRSKWHR